MTLSLIFPCFSNQLSYDHPALSARASQSGSLVLVLVLALEVGRVGLGDACDLALGVLALLHLLLPDDTPRIRHGRKVARGRQQ